MTEQYKNHTITSINPEVGSYNHSMGIKAVLSDGYNEESFTSVQAAKDAVDRYEANMLKDN